jgi:hypothetical protein
LRFSSSDTLSHNGELWRILYKNKDSFLLEKKPYLSLQSPFHSVELFHGFKHRTNVTDPFGVFKSLICVTENACPVS